MIKSRCLINMHPSHPDLDCVMYMCMSQYTYSSTREYDQRMIGLRIKHIQHKFVIKIKKIKKSFYFSFRRICSKILKYVAKNYLSQKNILMPTSYSLYLCTHNVSNRLEVFNSCHVIVLVCYIIQKISYNIRIAIGLFYII